MSYVAPSPTLKVLDLKDVHYFKIINDLFRITSLL